MIGHISYPDTVVYRQQWRELQAEAARDHEIETYLVRPRGRRLRTSRRRAVAAVGAVLFLGTLVAVPWLNQRVFIADAPSGAGVVLPARDQPPARAAVPHAPERLAAPGETRDAVEGAIEPSTVDTGS